MCLLAEWVSLKIFLGNPTQRLCIRFFDHCLQEGLNNEISYLGILLPELIRLFWKERRAEWLIG